MSPLAVTFFVNLLSLLSSIISILELVVVVGVVLSWLITFGVVNVRNRGVYQVVSVIQGVSDRLLYPIRRFVPAVAGLDFSPIIFIFLCGMVQRLLIAPLIAQVVAMGAGGF